MIVRFPDNLTVDPANDRPTFRLAAHEESVCAARQSINAGVPPADGAVAEIERERIRCVLERNMERVNGPLVR